jgi:hypothetical protein
MPNFLERFLGHDPEAEKTKKRDGLATEIQDLELEIADMQEKLRLAMENDKQPQDLKARVSLPSGITAIIEQQRLLKLDLDQKKAELFALDHP